MEVKLPDFMNHKLMYCSYHTYSQTLAIPRSVLLSCAEMVQVRLTCTRPKVDWLGRAAAAEVSDLNWLVCRNAVPKVF